MIGRLYGTLRQRFLERRAAVWVVRMDEDRAHHEAGLRRWVGRYGERAEAYKSAYRAYHDAGVTARKVYGVRSVHGSEATRGARREYRICLVLATGLSLLVAVAGVRLVLTILNGAAVTPSISPIIGVQYATRVGEVRTIRLRDESRIVLDADSVIRVVFTKTERGVMLEHGRARFEVAHDSALPFVVRAGGGMVTARGTVFDVEAYEAVRVRLISGSIDVSYPQIPGKRSVAPVHLSAGQQLRFDPALAEPPGAPTATPRSDTQWVSGMKTLTTYQ